MDEFKAEDRYATIPAPPGTPKWAIGVVFVLSMGFSAATATYLAVSPDFRAYLSNKKETDLASIASTEASNKRLTDGVLSAVGVCASQLSDLSRALGAISGDKDSLARQIVSLNEEVQKKQVALELCERSLLKGKR